MKEEIKKKIRAPTKALPVVGLCLLTSLGVVGCSANEQYIKDYSNAVRVLQEVSDNNVQDDYIVAIPKKANPNGSATYHTDIIISNSKAGAIGGSTYLDMFIALSLDIKYNYTSGSNEVTCYAMDYKLYYSLMLPELNYTENQLNTYVEYNVPISYDYSRATLGEVYASVTLDCSYTHLTDWKLSFLGIDYYFGETELNVRSCRDYSKDIVIGNQQVELDGAYTNGYNDGYAKGYDDGLINSVDENGLRVLFNSILESPAHIVAEMFNFEIFGINISSIVLVVLTIGVVLLAVGVFKGKGS